MALGEDGFGGFDTGDSNQSGYMALDPHQKAFRGDGKHARAKKGLSREKMAEDPNDPTFFDPNFDEEEPATARMPPPDEDQSGYMAVDPHMKHFHGSSGATRAKKGGARAKKKAAGSDMDPNDPNFFMEEEPSADSDSDDPDDWEEDEVFQAVRADVVVPETKDLQEELARLSRLAETDYDFTTKKKEYLGTDKQWVSEQHGRLEVQPWWRPKHGRGDSNKEFKMTKRGCFCVRPSETELGTYACSISMGDSKMKHMLLLPSYAGKDSTAEGKTVYRFGTQSKLYVNSKVGSDQVVVPSAPRFEVCG